jgi:hypothetical protein
MGSPRKVVSAYAQDWGADLIVAGSHGHSALKVLRFTRTVQLSLSGNSRARNLLCTIKNESKKSRYCAHPFFPFT